MKLMTYHFLNLSRERADGPFGSFALLCSSCRIENEWLVSGRSRQLQFNTTLCLKTGVPLFFIVGGTMASEPYSTYVLLLINVLFVGQFLTLE